MIHKFYFLVVATILIGCNQSQTKPSHLLPSGKILSFELDDQTPNVSPGFAVFGDLLFNILWEQNQLQIYDITHSRLLKSLDFEVEGDQGVGALFGFHVHNLDSIFLFGQASPVIHLTDTTGRIKNSIRYGIPDGYSAAFVHPQYYVSPPQVDNGELMVKTHVTGNYREMSNDNLKDKRLGYSIDLNTGQTSFIAHTYPDDYLERGLKQFEASMAVGKDKIVYSFFGDHRLFYASSFAEELQSRDAASQYLDATLKLFPVNGERIETQQYMFTSSRYDNLVYDPYRDVYYRFAYPTLDISDSNEIMKLRNAPGPFLIMILDSDLQVQGETFFEKGKYMPLNFFIHEEGLYLSVNHPDNPENDEDQFKFELIELSRK